MTARHDLRTIVLAAIHAVEPARLVTAALAGDAGRGDRFRIV
jgi:hypothetical protein